MVAMRFVVIVFALFTFADPAVAKYRGPVIDAHSQFGCDITAAEIRRVIKQNGVNHTLISARSGCRGEAPLDSQDRTAALVETLKGRASLLVSTKLGGMGKEGGRPAKQGLYSLRLADHRYGEEAVGFGEILVQHPPHDDIGYAGLDLDLKSYRVEQAIELVKSRGVPVVLHVELNYFEARSTRLIRQLNDLATANPDTNFVLIHMAQATVAEARDLIENHRNIYFMTSTSDALAAAAKAPRRRQGQTVKTGWVNLFNDPPRGTPYRGWFDDYLPGMRWREDWKALIEAHPDRFVFAMDNVFEPQWTRSYPFVMKLWRKAFTLLPAPTARKLACSNAKRLWRLEVDCGE